ncbi:MAG TPA: isoprenylcysteine carboxylmethyltransferase family protein [Planctomycetota bacterium]|nr:isoprenylcysteine carboxylmethyltransferase family protein [Planctomycetota bacterium]
MDDLALFDTGRWPAREALARIFGCLLVVLLVANRILQLPGWPGYIQEVRWVRPWFETLAFLPKALLPPAFDLELRYTGYGYTRSQIHLLWSLELLLWFIETGLLLGYAIVWLTRPPARASAKGFMQTAFPMLLVILPFGIVTRPYTYNRWMPENAVAHLGGLYAINGALIAAGLLNLAGLVALRRSFSIMAEARVFVRAGPYRWVRHPMYLAHFVIFFCCTLLRLQMLTVGLYLAFFAGQALRARIEERKLSEAFPEYEEYRRSTGMFLPRLF